MEKQNNDLICCGCKNTHNMTKQMYATEEGVIEYFLICDGCKLTVCNICGEYDTDISCDCVCDYTIVRCVELKQNKNE